MRPLSALDLTVRLATADDLEPALRMRARCWRESYADIRDESFFDWVQTHIPLEATWWSHGLMAGAELYIAQVPEEHRHEFPDSEGIVALAAATPTLPEDAATGVEIEMNMLHVDPEWESRYGDAFRAQEGQSSASLGARMLETVLGGRPALVWEVEEDRAAVDFYRRHGFQPDGVREALDDHWAGLHEIRLVRSQHRS